MTNITPVHSDVIDKALAVTRQAIGDGAVITDPVTCAYHSQDVFATGPTVAAVIRPTSIRHL
ncbi:MAG: hypothetical protein ACKVKT_04080, partial [Rhodospirillales bacterium]